MPFGKQKILPGWLFHFSMPEKKMGMKGGDNQDTLTNKNLRVQAAAHPNQGLRSIKQGRDGSFSHGQNNRRPDSSYFPVQMGKTLPHITWISSIASGGALQGIGYIDPVRIYLYGLHHPPEHLVLFTITPELTRRGAGPAPVAHHDKTGWTTAIPGRQKRP